ncbi:MAG: isochorismatase family protein [Planctomycetota bacterium]
MPIVNQTRQARLRFAGLSAAALVAIAASAVLLASPSRPALADDHGGQDQAMGSAGQAVGHLEAWVEGGERERLTPDNCVFLFVDHQAGLMNLVDNVDMPTYKADVMAKAKIGKLHGVPVVITTSAAAGPNGPKLPEIVAMFPDAPLIERTGQINAWDDPNFRAAVEATGRKKAVVSGITTDVCVAFVTLSMLEAGYDVYVVADASGTTNAQVQAVSLMRMAEAGAEMGNWFALACELLSDWRNPEGAETAKIFAEHMPGYAEAMASHSAFTGQASEDAEY